MKKKKFKCFALFVDQVIISLMVFIFNTYYSNIKFRLKTNFFGFFFFILNKTKMRVVI